MKDRKWNAKEKSRFLFANTQRFLGCVWYRIQDCNKKKEKKENEETVRASSVCECQSCGAARKEQDSDVSVAEILLVQVKVKPMVEDRFM